MEKPTRLALLKEIAEFLNEETETYNMIQGALEYLIGISNFIVSSLIINYYHNTNIDLKILDKYFQ